MPLDTAYHLNLFYLRDRPTYGSTSLVQIGRMFCKPKTLIDTHFHTGWFELTIVTAGKGVITTNDVTQNVKQGDIYLSFPRDLHKIETDPNDPLKYDFFSFTSEDPEINAALDEITKLYYMPEKRIFTDNRINSLVANAINEFGTETFGKDAVLKAIFDQILIYLVRDFRGIAPVNAFVNVKDSEAFCYKVMNYIDTHLYSIKSLNEVSDAFGYSFGYLSTLFKKTTSRTLSQYYTEKRAQSAKLLVEERCMKISQIAEMMGYSSVYAFSKAFKQWFGCPPREYLKNKNS